MVELDKKGKSDENWVYQRFLADAKRLHPRDEGEATQAAAKSYQHYMANIQYTAADIEDGEGLNCTMAIWGEQDIDGRILREKLGIKLHVIELLQIKEGLLIGHQLDGKTIEETEVGYTAKDTVHITVFNNHFVPILPVALADSAVANSNKQATTCKSPNRAKNEGICEDYYLRQAQGYINYTGYINAAALYQCAKACYNEPVSLELRAKLNLVIELFIQHQVNSEKDSTKPCADYWLKQQGYIDKLNKIYALANESVATVNLLDDSIRNLYITISSEFINLVKAIVFDAKKLLEEMNLIPQGRYCTIVFGSLARFEMTPYSDLEFGFLIDNPLDKAYFEKLTVLMQLAIINLGKTRLEELGIDLLSKAGITSRIKKGFGFDGYLGGKTPLGKYKLIKTPKELADYQDDEWFEKERFLYHELNTCLPIEGDKDLYQQYLAAVTQQLDKKQRKNRARNLLLSNIIRFEPKLGKSIQTKHIYPVKFDFYRLPNLVLDALFEFNEIKDHNVWHRLDKLYEMHVLTEEDYNYTKFHINQINFWRIKTYLSHGEQNEALVITEEDDLLKAYAFLTGLHKAAINFYFTDYKIANFRLSINTGEPPLLMEAKFHLKKGDYPKALYKLLRAFKDCGNDFWLSKDNQVIRPDSLPSFANNIDQAKINYKMFDLSLDALTIANWIDKCAGCLGRLKDPLEYNDDINYPYNVDFYWYKEHGLFIYNFRGDYRRSLTSFEKAINLFNSEKHLISDYLIALNYAGRCCDELGLNAQALNYYQTGLLAAKQHYIVATYHITDLRHNLAICYERKGELNEALATYDEAIKIDTKIEGPYGYELAKTYANRAMVNVKLRNFQNVQQDLKHALSILSRNADSNRATGNIYRKLAGACLMEADYNEAEQYCLKSIAIDAKYNEPLLMLQGMLELLDVYFKLQDDNLVQQTFGYLILTYAMYLDTTGNRDQRISSRREFDVKLHEVMGNYFFYLIKRLVEQNLHTLDSEWITRLYQHGMRFYRLAYQAQAKVSIRDINLASIINNAAVAAQLVGEPQQAISLEQQAVKIAEYHNDEGRMLHYNNNLYLFKGSSPFGKLINDKSQNLNNARLSYTQQFCKFFRINPDLPPLEPIADQDITQNEVAKLFKY